MRLICSVTPNIYTGVRKYERRYRKTNDTERIKSGVKSSIQLGKLAIDFLSNYKKTVDKTYDGNQEEFYDPGKVDWDKLINEYKEEWVEDIPLINHNDVNEIKNNVFKENHLLNVCMSLKKLSDEHLETIDDEEERFYWRKNVERFINESINLAFKLTKKMNEYIEEYGRNDIILNYNYNWKEESDKWLNRLSMKEFKKEDSENG